MGRRWKPGFKRTLSKFSLDGQSHEQQPILESCFRIRSKSRSMRYMGLEPSKPVGLGLVEHRQGKKSRLGLGTGAKTEARC